MNYFCILLLFFLCYSCGCHRDDPGSADTDNPVDTTGTNTGITPGEKASYYVATNGSDSNVGTFDHPWASWQKAFSTAGSGDTVFICGGVYYPDAEDEFGVWVSNRKGSHAFPICIFNYPGENPVLNCSTLTSVKANSAIVLSRCSQYHLRGLTVTGISQHQRSIESCGFSFELGGTYLLENCISHGNEGSGFQGYALDTISLVNCDAYDNFDKYTADYSGGQADGFVFCFTNQKSYTYFRGCRSWYNSDDGYDCWENEGIVKFEECWAFNNGRGQGDGGGFKLGQTEKTALPVPQRILTNCLAFKNRFIGFNQNEGNVDMIFYNNSSFDNDEIGFDIGEYKLNMIVRNNISYKNGSIGYFSSTSVNDHNSWNSSTKISISDADFVSLDTTGVGGERQANHSLPVLNFLKLANGSDLINAGLDVGIPFLGKAPDLGAYEKE